MWMMLEMSCDLRTFDLLVIKTEARTQTHIEFPLHRGLAQH